MQHIESIQEFYENLAKEKSISLSSNNTGVGHFNVFPREYCRCVVPYHRRDFYKISLIIGDGVLNFGDKQVIVDRPALLIGNPLVPYSWEATSKQQTGWFCLFTEEFVRSRDSSSLKQEYPIFRLGEAPIHFLNDKSLHDITSLFENMMKEMSSDYIYKYDVLRNYLHLLIHQVVRMRPDTSFKYRIEDAAHRITYEFLEVLESQFPIESPDIPLRLKTVQDYAQRLSIHINHLNHSVKEVTGKTTSQHISSRIIQEAKALLIHSNRSISEIAYSLGFEYPSYFTNYFTKRTGESPKNIRLK